MLIYRWQLLINIKYIYIYIYIIFIYINKLYEESESQNMNGVGENVGITGSKSLLLQNPSKKKMSKLYNHENYNLN